MDDITENYTDTVRPIRRNHPRQLSTNEVKNFDRADKKEIYYLLISHGIFPEEQKGYCRTGRTNDQLYRGKHNLKEAKMW